MIRTNRATAGVSATFRPRLDILPPAEPPERALADPVRFLVHVMTYGTIEDIAVVRRYVELDDLREALDRAPPGIKDERSWAYWNAVTGRYPAPPMPQRIIP